MRKLKNASCATCNKPIQRHDKQRLVVEVKSSNPKGAKVTMHLNCPE